ncbi:signal transduction histidine kinase [Streptomyces sp. Amel2xB2]|uniref:sensor histidine kinase n=1 Tax=Streptomyces sp. Amel2xB2 TaxID=1305829 RepID=UPI000DBAB475|nr:histidine kinase [Streptomyces sp. Amel2xB2]RAJ68735.1 signal transduction histidine kinase [Streptomyces sp. Amel2xB2]
MKSELAPRLASWRQAWHQIWRLAAAAAVGVPIWLAVGVVLHRGQGTETGIWFFVADPLVALTCLTLLWWRRRFPLTVAMTVAVASTVSALATGAALLALVSLATRRRPAETGAVALAYVVASWAAPGIYDTSGSPDSWWIRLAIPALTAGIAVAAGAAVGARRVEVRSLRERALSAEREQAARAAQARATERNRIAREMHDVLAHRISLVAMQASVLDHRPDLAAEESRMLVRGVADGSHQALEELRDVLGVLRAAPDRPEAPQPSLDGIPELAADARASGLDVTLSTTVTGTPSETAGRTCYRIVQEGLTNAAKHAPGAHVRVTLDGEAGRTLDVSVVNSAAAAAPTRPPASGFGLLGLGERVTLAGGELIHHPTPGDGYRLAAQLPWPRDAEKRT